MSDGANKKPLTPEEIREASRKRAIKNLAAAIEWLELPDSGVDDSTRVGTLLVAIAGASYALAKMLSSVEEVAPAIASPEDEAAPAVAHAAWVN